MSNQKNAVSASDAKPKVVSQDDWLRARLELLTREKELTRLQDAVAADRRRMPMVQVENSYIFETEKGSASLLELFKDKQQLIVYHFMFNPIWERGCPSCSQWADENLSPSMVKNIEEGGAAFTCVSRAPLSKIEKYKEENGWTFPWCSSGESSFNFDFNVTLDDKVKPIVYNYKSLAEHKAAGTDYYFEGEPPYELPGKSVFLRHDGNIFHTYSTFGRGCEATGGSQYFLDMTPYGRQETWEDSPPGWPQKPLFYTDRAVSEKESVNTKGCCEHD